MEKVYLLLRNNQQTGPHSLEELLQLQLKPRDLVWVEGKSYGWSYPTEIDTLQPYVKDTASAPKPQSQANAVSEPERVPNPRQPSHNKVYVSMPGGGVPFQSEPVSQDPIEQKAEELRKRIQSYSPQPDRDNPDIRTNYSRKLEDVEEDYTSWVFQKKRKKKILAGISPLALGITLLIATSGAWWMLKGSSARPEQPPVVSTATRVEESKEPTGTQPVDNSMITTVSNTETPVLKQPVTTNKIRAKKVQASIIPSTTSPRTASTSPDKVNDAQANQNTAVIAPSEENTEVAAAPQQPKEKRTIRGLLNVLFKKNKKEQEADDARAASTTSNGRSASRRDEEQSATIVDLSDQVQVRSNQSPADWMMGVQGLKLTLYNKSAAQLKNATVEVSYFSEQNDLLQKKTLSFSNIAPQKSQTVSAPDHRLADHVTYNVISATGESSAYANK
jgi:hypothetical protein